MITRLGSTPVFVFDQDRAVEFYRDKLGLAVVFDFPMGGGRRWIAMAQAPGETELILFHPDSYSGAAESMAQIRQRVGIWTGIIFLTDDIQSTYETLRDKGVEFEDEPRLQPWGGIEAFFCDPDANRFHLVQRPDFM